MRVVIVKDDNAVIIGGTRLHIDCSTLPEDFHALQWDDDTLGEVEYRRMTCEHCGGHSKKMNERVTDLTPYQPYIDAWHAENARLAAETAAKQAEIDKAIEAQDATRPEA